jgi:hypothetical protein
MFAIPVVLGILSATVDASAAARGDASASAPSQSTGPVLPSGTRSLQTPAVREVPPSQGTTNVPKATDNSAAPPSNDKTTEPRNVDRGGTPRPPDRSAPPQQMTDVPLSPPVAPPAEPRPNRTGGGPDKVNDIH